MLRRVHGAVFDVDGSLGVDTSIRGVGGGGGPLQGVALFAAAAKGQHDRAQGREAGGHDGGAGFDGAPDDPVDDGLGEVVDAVLVVLGLKSNHVVEAKGGRDDAAGFQED